MPRNVPFTVIGPEAGKLDGMSVIHADTLESGKPGDALAWLRVEHIVENGASLKNLTTG